MATPAAAVVSAAASIAKSASIAIAPPWRRLAGLASHSVAGNAKVAAPSPNSVSRRPVRWCRGGAGSSPASWRRKDLGAGELRPDLAAGWSLSGGGRWNGSGES